MVPGRGVVPLVCPLVPVDGEHARIGAFGQGQGGDFYLEFRCRKVGFICRVILEAGVENRIAVGLEVAEDDSGCSEVVRY